MWRFITLTFAFLAVGFYALSDGGDYEPRSGSRQAVAQSIPPAPSVTEISRPTSTESTEPRVTATDTDNTPAPRAEPAAATVVVKPARPDTGKKNHGNNNHLVKATLPSGIQILSADPTAMARIVASTKPTTTPGAKQARPKMVVKGTRVNMRSGPGKTYNVVARLKKGHEFDLLREENGWVKLRSTSTGRVGWMAAFLVKPSK